MLIVIFGRQFPSGNMLDANISLLDYVRRTDGNAYVCECVFVVSTIFYMYTYIESHCDVWRTGNAMHTAHSGDTVHSMITCAIRIKYAYHEFPMIHLFLLYAVSVESHHSTVWAPQPHSHTHTSSHRFSILYWLMKKHINVALQRRHYCQRFSAHPVSVHGSAFAPQKRNARGILIANIKHWVAYVHLKFH